MRKHSRTHRTRVVLAISALGGALLGACADQLPMQPVGLRSTNTAAASIVTGWTTQTPVCNAGIWPGSSGHPNGKVYMFGGGAGNSVTQVYNHVAKTWSIAAPMPAGVYGPGTALGTDGKIYVASGTSTGGIGAGVSDWMQIYDPATNNWLLGARMPIPTWTPAAVAASDGRIYVFGGQASPNRVQIYNPATNAWSLGPNIPTNRFEFGAARGPDGKLYLVGGFQFSPTFDAHATVDVFDPATNTWSTAAPMSRKRNNHTVVIGSNGRMYAIGGSTQYSIQDPSTDVESYDFATNTWRPEPSLITPNGAHGSGLAGDGYIYAFSGRAGLRSEALGAQPNNVPTCTSPPQPPGDNSPPVITSSVTGTLGSNGWYTSPVTVTFTVTDPESAITSTTGCGTNQFLTDTPSATASCSATSAGGTSSSSETVKIDQTDPIVTYANNAGTYDVTDNVAITCSATDAMSGVATTTCADISGAAYTFGAGAQSYSASATDNAGNEGSGSTSFTVVVTHNGLCALVRQFVSHNGIANSLCVKLRNAQAAAARGQDGASANMLDAFRNEVRAQTGKAVSASDAAVLLSLVGSL